MLTYLLKRVATGDAGTFGVLINDKNLPIDVTLERPWLNNQHDISCIPAGTYEVKRVTTPEHRECFELQNVPDRGAILIHAGNTIKDSKGCILLAKEYGHMYDGTPAVLISREAIKGFMDGLSGVDSFTLRIIDCT